MIMGQTMHLGASPYRHTREYNSRPNWLKI